MNIRSPQLRAYRYYLGAFLTDFIAFFIVVCTGATLFVHHMQIVQGLY